MPGPGLGAASRPVRSARNPAAAAASTIPGTIHRERDAILTSAPPSNDEVASRARPDTNVYGPVRCPDLVGRGEIAQGCLPRCRTRTPRPCSSDTPAPRSGTDDWRTSSRGNYRDGRHEDQAPGPEEPRNHPAPAPASGAPPLERSSQSGLPQRSRAATCSGLAAIEAFPVSPLILQPFTEPHADPHGLLAPSRPATPRPGRTARARRRASRTATAAPTSSTRARCGTACEAMPAPIIYRLKLQVAPHSLLELPGPQPGPLPRRERQDGLRPARWSRSCPQSTIYGFNGTFPGPMINAEYGKPVAWSASRTTSTRTRSTSTAATSAIRSSAS